MVSLWYTDLSTISSAQLQQGLQELPGAMQAEIGRFRKAEDRKAKTWGRLLVRHYCELRGIPFHWDQWAKGPKGKPTLTSGPAFNISHAGHWVVAAFADAPVGVDIECGPLQDVAALQGHFHPQEQVYLQKENFQEEAFLRLWTRKEAFLKATGEGIAAGLNQHNCLPDRVAEATAWRLVSVPFQPPYSLAYCTSSSVADHRLRAWEASQLLSNTLAL